MNGLSAHAVSYTHLDVYKRQVPSLRVLAVSESFPIVSADALGRSTLLSSPVRHYVTKGYARGDHGAAPRRDKDVYKRQIETYKANDIPCKSFVVISFALRTLKCGIRTLLVTEQELLISNSTNTLVPFLVALSARERAQAHARKTTVLEYVDLL